MSNGLSPQHPSPSHTLGRKLLLKPKAPSPFEVPIAIFWLCLRKIACNPILQALEFAEEPEPALSSVANGLL